MRRLSFSDVEQICEAERCRFNDLFLVGSRVFVMLDVENWRLPDKYRPLVLDDSEVMSALPEVLRRLDATQFESMEALERAVTYDAAHTAQFEKLKYEIYEVLTSASRGHEAPDGGQFYLELDGSDGEDILLVCDNAQSLDEPLVLSIQNALREGNYTLNWRVRASFEDDSTAIRIICKDRVLC